MFFLRVLSVLCCRTILPYLYFLPDFTFPSHAPSSRVLLLLPAFQASPNSNEDFLNNSLNTKGIRHVLDRAVFFIEAPVFSCFLHRVTESSGFESLQRKNSYDQQPLDKWSRIKQICSNFSYFFHFSDLRFEEFGWKTIWNSMRREDGNIQGWAGEHHFMQIYSSLKILDILYISHVRCEEVWGT